MTLEETLASCTVGNIEGIGWRHLSAAPPRALSIRCRERRGRGSVSAMRLSLRGRCRYYAWRNGCAVPGPAGRTPKLEERHEILPLLGKRGTDFDFFRLCRGELGGQVLQGGARCLALQGELLEGELGDPSLQHRLSLLEGVDFAEQGLLGRLRGLRRAGIDRCGAARRARGHSSGSLRAGQGEGPRRPDGRGRALGGAGRKNTRLRFPPHPGVPGILVFDMCSVTSLYTDIIHENLLQANLNAVAPCALYLGMMRVPRLSPVSTTWHPYKPLSTSTSLVRPRPTHRAWTP